MNNEQSGENQIPEPSENAGLNNKEAINGFDFGLVSRGLEMAKSFRAQGNPFGLSAHLAAKQIGEEFHNYDEKFVKDLTSAIAILGARHAKKVREKKAQTANTVDTEESLLKEIAEEEAAWNALLRGDYGPNNEEPNYNEVMGARNK